MSGVRLLAEPGGTAEPFEAVEAGALPEGAEGRPADPAQRDRVQAFRTSSESPIGLDILVETDEPEALIERLARLAQMRHSQPRWDIVWIHASACLQELERFNRPASRR